MKLASASFLLTILLCPGLRADFNVTAWRYRRLVQGPGQGQTAFFFPDPVLYQGSLARLDDLRLVQGGVETAWLIDVSRPQSGERDVPATVLNRSVVPGEGLRFTLDAGAAAPPHDRVKIDTPRTNFRSRVKIEISDDARTWSVVRSDGLIFDVSQADKAASELSVRFPQSTLRFLRVTIEGWTDPDSVTGASLATVFDDPGARDRVFSLDHPAAVEDREAQSTDVILDIGYPGLPHDSARFTTEAGPFSRTVAVDSSTNREQWVEIAQHTISRTPRAEQLTVEFPEQWDRYLRAANHPARRTRSARAENTLQACRKRTALVVLRAGRCTRPNLRFDCARTRTRTGPGNSRTRRVKSGLSRPNQTRD